MSRLASENNVFSEGICRCCLSVGHYKDIKATFNWMGEHETYMDMLKECFNIDLNPVQVKNLDSAICEVCITELRAAHNFRLQVLNCEKDLFDRHTNIKIEFDTSDDDIVKDEPVPSDIFIEVDFNSPKLEDPINVNQCEDRKKSLLINTRSTSSVKIKGIGDTKTVGTKKEVVHNSTRASKIVHKHEDPRSLLKHNRHKAALNAKLLLENSTASPFKWSCRDGYICFYCGTKITDADTLRQHTLGHKQENLLRLLVKQIRISILIKVDITNLRCTCGELVSDLTVLKEHLTRSHGKKFAKTSQEALLAFKLTDGALNCLLCGESFIAFQMLNSHLNTHFDNYVCETCGATFVTERRLTQHQKTHGDGELLCEMCQKKFPSPSSLDNHKWKVHIKKMKYKCHCGEVFGSYYSKQKHRIDKHNEKHLQIKCEPCNLYFPRKTIYTNHIRRMHLRERNYRCEECNNQFFSAPELKCHKLKHTQEKKHQCGICKKRYGRKYTLVEHMRIHNNDRRFVCNVCGQAFIQKCSLKAHIAKHH